MNAILRQQYEEARETAINEVAYMLNSLDRWAEEKGGAENLSPDDQRAYDSRHRRIVRLSAFADRTQEYIDDLENWVAELIQQNRSIAAKVADAEKGWRQYFPRMTKGADPESVREHQRFLSITQAKMDFPDLY